MKKDILIPLLIGVLMIIAFLFVAKIFPIVLVFIPAVIVTFLFYLKMANQQPPNPEKILPVYLLLLGVQFLHFMEEYLGDFTEEVPRLLGQEAYPEDYWVTFYMIAYFIFILGGIIIFKKKKALMMIPLFFIVAGVILNTIGHILISLYLGEYFPGLYTALIYLLLGPILIKRLLQASKINSVRTNSAKPFSQSQ